MTKSVFLNKFVFFSNSIEEQIQESRDKLDFIESASLLDSILLELYTNPMVLIVNSFFVVMIVY